MMQVQNYEIPVVILAAGEAKRLKPLSNQTIKPIIPILGIPMIERIIDNYYSNHFRHFFIVIGEAEISVKNIVEQMEIVKNNLVDVSFIIQKKALGMADAIFDIVSTGSTLLSNGLKEVDVVMQSEAVLIHHPKINTKKQQILDDLLFRIRAVNQATNYKYILLNAPNSAIKKISALLPGMKSPTIIPLAEEGWSSIHSVIKEDDFWVHIENLKRAGAQGILVIPIEKMIL